MHRRLDRGVPLRAAMQGAGLDIPSLAAKTGLSKSLVGFVAGRGRSAREECSDRAAGLIASALGVPLDSLFSAASPMPTESTSTRRQGTGVAQDLPAELLDQQGLARWLRKSPSWIDKQIQETKGRPAEQRFPVHYAGRSRRFNPGEVLAYLDRQHARRTAA